jgi:hypothetical protein
MKTKPLLMVAVWVVLLGLLAWRFDALGAIQSLAADAQCVGGRCPVKSATAATAQPGQVNTWPPRLGEPYPDLTLIDQTGEPVRLSSFKGSVILIEPVGMTCSGCQAFSGAHRRGSFKGITPQPGLPSMEELFPRFTGGLSLSDRRIVFVQILLYSMSMDAPTPADAREWAEHFGLDRSKNHVVLAGTKDLLGQASYDMIPGFQLVDRNFVLQADSTGHNPRHNLVSHLLPMVPQLLSAPAVNAGAPALARTRTAADIEAAYRAIPHRRTVFDGAAAKMSPEERAYLQQLFEIVDLGIVERVETLTWLQSDRSLKRSAENYARAQSQLSALTVPRRLASVHRLIAAAMAEQRAALEEWQTAAVPADLAKHPLVASSSDKLRKAYAELMALFPQEGINNQAAFFDYLCALDFI